MGGMKGAIGSPFEGLLRSPVAPSALSLFAKLTRGVESTNVMSLDPLPLATRADWRRGVCMRCKDIGGRASGERFACLRGVVCDVEAAGAGVGGEGKSTRGPDFICRFKASSSSSSWKRESKGASYVIRLPRLERSTRVAVSKKFRDSSEHHVNLQDVGDFLLVIYLRTILGRSFGWIGRSIEEWVVVCIIHVIIATILSSST